MPEPDSVAAQGGGSNSSDFVRKLYKMLEDPAYSNIVRWGNEGDTFVILETDKFTNDILPKHFKHSNFSSFVRQLNKYDFHKLRRNDENNESPYGKQAWEFKHSAFRADRKDNLDNIRRKAPAQRKTQQTEDQFTTNQSINLLQETLFAQQQQVQALQEQVIDIQRTNKTLLADVTAMHKIIDAQRQAQHELLNYMGHADDRMRGARYQNPHMNGGGVDEHAPELRRARELLSSVQTNPAVNQELERLNGMYAQSSPPDSASGLMFQAGSAGMPPMMAAEHLNMRHLVYPVGENVGIDPLSQDHFNNIPYTLNSLPMNEFQNPVVKPEPGPATPAPAAVAPPRPPSNDKGLWGRKKPRVYLVEDDRTCSRIGSKFLTQMECIVEIAENGIDAVNKCKEVPSGHYDLIFMDIVMPQMDGVSATQLIREVHPDVPVVAMTSNIRPEDISHYFNWSLNDVLAKPFTKDGMLRILRKHVAHLLKDAPQDDLAVGHGAAQLHAANMSVPAMNPGVKFDSTPSQSPATTTSWHSPGQIHQPSPNVTNIETGYPLGNTAQMVITPTSAQRPNFQNMPPGMQQMRVPDHMDDRPEKRQRLYGPQGGYA
ncbi:Transcription factor prr1 [Colletotrichum gloeosporioides]|uniref:Transcription factor n=2 Tax=Colletotrichum gloeosporioides TaxID=474922 RepID=T0LYP1_COLGC|nr:Transcription factor prr1 [Colletotrichum gloeosporioides]EQB53600.1 HSF-type DNA-binding protein [Colletotrichum gloeosporioides Cg-14]KAF4827316.1 Transcription factor SKN7 [Colletotrichum tropicale]KAI8238493.1 Transcription factor SKN7 [Colletotrichum sp. SAR 10_96]KAI8271940.1 Transcription factor SKN7 [Colletotrichum sp. SAR 10_98]KAF3806013.1 Transcription factor prr1 [Colletotrichum gloeosporioides]